MKVNIITDSSADFLERYNEDVIIVPLVVSFGEKEYIDRIELTKEAFYEKLVEVDELPKTSQANPSVFAELFQEITDKGESAVVLTLSSKLSGTYQSACIAAEDYENIYVVDTENATTGSGILVEYAVECMKKGMDAKTLKDHLDEKKKDICLVALLDTLEYLKKGGRISKTLAFAGGVLNIKPVVSVIDGEVCMIGKARGSKNGNNLLREKILEYGGIDYEKPILLGYTGLSDKLLKKYISDSQDLWADYGKELEYVLVGSTVGTHVGPGGIVATFFKK